MVSDSTHITQAMLDVDVFLVIDLSGIYPVSAAVSRPLKSVRASARYPLYMGSPGSYPLG